MQTVWKVRGLGLALVLAAVPAFLFLAEPLGGMLAFALAVTGLFVTVVVAEPAVPARFGQALVEGDTAVLDEVAGGLRMQGGPVYVHDQGNVGAERLFLAASDNERPVPILDDQTLAYAGTGGTKVGLTVRPPGLRLVELHEAEASPLVAGASLSEAEAFLGGLFATHDLVDGFAVTKAGGRLRVRFAAQALEPPCLDQPLDPACRRTGCVVCQAAGCALARSLQRPVAVDEARIEEEQVLLHLRPEEPGDASTETTSSTEERHRERSSDAREAGPDAPGGSP